MLAVSTVTPASGPGDGATETKMKNFIVVQDGGTDGTTYAVDTEIEIRSAVRALHRAGQSEAAVYATPDGDKYHPDCVKTGRRIFAPQLVVSEAKFMAEVRRLGGTTQGAADWLAEAVSIGLDADDTAESLAWTCVDDELSNLDADDPRAATLRASLEAARVDCASWFCFRHLHPPTDVDDGQK